MGIKPPVEVAGLGAFHPFAFEHGGPVIGAMADIQDRPGVHPHWLFQFPVASLPHAVEVVRAGGGLVVGPFTGPGGEQIAVCDDPQGAAFALRQQA